MDTKKTAILACKVLKYELEAAIKNTGVTYPVFYPEKNLHDFPNQLRVEQQKVLDSLADYERVIMAFAYCGNAAVGLKTHQFELIFPRLDDCISLMFGSMKNRANYVKDKPSIFLTKGWLEGEGNIAEVYQHTCQKFGEEKGQRLMRLVYKHYTDLTVLDTKAYRVEDILDETQKYASLLNLNHSVINAEFTQLEELLTGPWDSDKFEIIPPHSTVPETILLVDDEEKE